MTMRTTTTAVRHTGCGHVVALAVHPSDLDHLASRLRQQDPAWELAEDLPMDAAVIGYWEWPCDTCGPPS
jgi:hypothetical protein